MYHIWLIIADIGDAQLDSGVFIEAGSLTTGTDELSLKDKVSIYPVPVTRELNVDQKLPLSFSDYQLLDVAGDIILKGSMEQFNTLNVEELSNGMYILHLLSPNGNGVQKIIKN